ncbi:hypothetical protein [Gorillibacterium sp. sgz500922]|uniref:hypothetical protein n=1 Tax=Gorillibacterium sp. sgz500922 TaxID=3446694 RepID=UPI003F6689E8
MAKQEGETRAETLQAPTFSVEQLLASKQFSGVEKDVLRGVLEPDRSYSLDEARVAMKVYAESEVQ